MDLYVARGLHVPTPLPHRDDPDVIALSRLLQKLPVHGVRLHNFRNPDAVARKLGNFRSVQVPGTGSTNHARMDEQVWARFKDDFAKLRKEALKIRAAI